MNRFKLDLKELRKTTGMTQKQLSKRLNVKPTSVSYWENSKNTPPIEYVLKIINFFRLKPREIKHIFPELMIGSKNFLFNIRLLRKQRKITQKELSKLLNIGQSAISSWEKQKNTPPIETIIKIAQMLNVSLDELIIFKQTHEETGQMYIDLMNKKDRRK